MFIFVQQTGRTVLGLTPDQISKALNVSWTLPLAATVERLTTVIMHLTLSIMVWIAVSRRAWIWFVAAILWHALVDGSVLLLQNIGLTIWAIEGILAGVMLINIAGLYIMSMITSQTVPSIANSTIVLID